MAIAERDHVPAIEGEHEERLPSAACVLPEVAQLAHVMAFEPSCPRCCGASPAPIGKRAPEAVSLVHRPLGGLPAWLLVEREPGSTPNFLGLTLAGARGAVRAALGVTTTAEAEPSRQPSSSGRSRPSPLACCTHGRTSKAPADQIFGGSTCFQACTRGLADNGFDWHSSYPLRALARERLACFDVPPTRGEGLRKLYESPALIWSARRTSACIHA